MENWLGSSLPLQGASCGNRLNRTPETICTSGEAKHRRISLQVMGIARSANPCLSKLSQGFACSNTQGSSYKETN